VSPDATPQPSPRAAHVAHQGSILARAPALALVAALATAFPHPAAAWGAPGHRIVAAIAEERLEPAARTLVREIVGDLSLSDPDIATWADALRDRRTKPWHYVNIPFGARYDRARDCPASRGCAVELIQRAAAELQRHGPAMQRADALRWLVHVVADIHQPLHAGDGWDRGGNGFRVRIGRRREPTAFHHVWDTEVVAPLVRHRGPLVAAQSLSAAISPSDAAQSAAVLDPAVWANESSRQAQEIYAELQHRPRDTAIVALPHAYAALERQRVEAALQRAGVRLAALLNRIARARLTVNVLLKPEPHEAVVRRAPGARRFAWPRPCVPRSPPGPGAAPRPPDSFPFPGPRPPSRASSLRSALRAP
jgi:hypothetical protein